MSASSLQCLGSELGIPLHRLPVLTAESCGSIVQKIMALSAEWEQRAAVDFYTLGAVTYLDGCCDDEPYRSRCQLYNSILMDVFAELYALLTTALSNVLGQVQFHPRLGVPGFHIFAAKPGLPMSAGTSAWAARGGSIHFDFQYKDHVALWQSCRNVEWHHPLSFTLPLELPRGGGGLNIWPDVRSFEDHIDKAPQQVSYHCGELVWFSRPLLHQIAPAYLLTPWDRRITLQGHGLRCDGTWMLYL